MTYFLPISVGTFTKGLGFADLCARHLARRCLHSGSDDAEPPAAAQAGTVRCACACLANIFWLGTKELRSFFHDCGPAGSRDLLVLSRRVSRRRKAIRRNCTTPRSAMVDEDHSELSRRIAQRLSAALFQAAAADRRTRHRPADECRAIHLRPRHPAEFQRDVLGGPRPAVQVNVDATAMVQAGPGLRLRRADRHDRDRQFLSIPRGRAAAVRSSLVGPGRVQSQRRDIVVHQRHGDHQQCDDARDHSGRRGHRARTRAWDDGSSAGHAGDARSRSRCRRSGRTGS